MQGIGWGPNRVGGRHAQDKKKKNGGDALHVCSSLIIMTEGATSSSIANVAAKSVTQTDKLGGTSWSVQPPHEPDDRLNTTEVPRAIVLEKGRLVQTLEDSIDRLKLQVTAKTIEPSDAERARINDDGG